MMTKDCIRAKKRLDTILSRNYKNIKGLYDALGQLKGICQRNEYIDNDFIEYATKRIFDEKGIKWNTLRDRKHVAKYKKENKVCERCKTKKSEQVHHIISLHKGGMETYENYMALCKECHTIADGNGIDNENT